MTRPGLIHTNALTPPDLFWRIAGVIFLTVGVLIGVAFAVGPLVLLAVYRNPWLLLLLPLVPAGAWMAVKVFKHGQTLRWHYAHLSEFTLHEDRIEAVEWRTPFMKGVQIRADEAPRERTIPLNAVTSVVASFAIVRRTTTPRHAIPIIETAPVLYIRYDDDGRQELLSVPFSSHKDEGVDRWLGYFAGAGIPLFYTPRTLFRHDTQILTDADRLKHLNAAADLIPYTFAEGWLADEHELGTQWRALDTAIRHEEEARDPELKDKRARHSGRTWISMALIFVWLMIAVFFQQLAAQWGYLEPFNPLVSFLCVLAFGFAFFHRLRSYLRWPYMFIYSGGVLLSAIAALIPSRPGLELEVSESFFIAALIYLPLCWVPYVVVKAATKKLRERDGKSPELLGSFGDSAAG
ncbi:hypothetical protein ASH00_12930 [Arthrobacter sp. Soil782]|uniref:hypothetical protein n=1 Tax=Arthrobacter sp. Soil782 TaxID=1736410 RepID=UPI0006FDA9BF|nr:hypothetical protein [Arthrobacter sp. Soil782]KRF05287.1 hypothetical protein ASH00_12930 [Arthrobacter sp. Soil782]